MMPKEPPIASRLAKALACTISALALVLACLPVLPASAAPAAGDNAAAELASELSEQFAEQQQVLEQAAGDGVDAHRALAAYNAQKRRGTTAPSTSANATQKPRKQAAELPSEYYLTNLGQVTEVKDQGKWSNCWAYGGAAALESAVLKQQSTVDPSGISMEEPQLTGLPSASTGAPDYSERHLTYFAFQNQTEATAGNQAGEGLTLLSGNVNAAFDDTGGYDQLTEALWTAQQGIVADEYAPYSTSPALATDDPHRLDTSNVTITDMVYLDTPAVYNDSGRYTGYDASGTAAIKQALMDKGVVALGINAAKANASDNGDTWCQYNRQTRFSVNHEVAIVGWDDNYAATNFGTNNPASDAVNNPAWGYTSNDGTYNGAWLVKNSWGPDWGLADGNGNKTGFFWVSYYDHSIESLTAYSVVDDAAYDNVHQYDYLGVVYAGSYAVGRSLKAANIFTAGKDNAGPNGQGTNKDELLSAVSVRPLYASKSNVTIEIYLLDDNDTVPTDGELVHTQTVENVENGFHIIPLNKQIRLDNGQRYAVVEQVSFVEDSATYYDLALEFADDESDMGFSYNAVINDGETLVCYGNTWMSVQDLNSELGSNGYDYVCNALIKAYTNNRENVSDRLEITTSNESFVYDGTAKEFSSLSVSLDGSALSADSYTVIYANNVNAGTATATVKVETDAVAGTKAIQFSIAKASLENASVALPSNSITYDGASHELGATVTLGGKALPASDYTVAYSDTVNVTQNLTVTVTPKSNNVTGSCVLENATSPIEPASLEGATVELSQTSFEYDGTAKEPTASVTLASGTALPESDYSVTYTGNTDITDSATVTVKPATANVTGQASATFAITLPADVQTLIDLIVALPKTISSDEDLEAVRKAQAAYLALNSIAKALVDNSSVADAFESALSAASAYEAATPLAGARVSINAQTYSGSALRPAVKVVLNERSLTRGTDYDVAYANNTNVGTATVTVTGKGNYKGKVTGSFAINPKGTVLKKLKRAKRALTAIWAKQAAQTSGYEIRYSIKKNMKGAKTKAVKNPGATKLKIKKLKSKKKYYVQIRTYKTVAGKKYFSAWSAKKAAKTK